MCEYFSLKVFKELSLKAIVRFHFHQNNSAFAENSLACLCEFFKNRYLVYFCSGCYKISQFVSCTYYSRMYLKSVVSLV